MVALGGKTQEFAAVVATKGPEAKGKDGNRIAIIEGRSDTVSVDTIAENAYGGYHGASEFELVHNHPKPYPLSGGDLRWLSEHPKFKTIEQVNEFGGWSRASIVRHPGMTDDDLYIDGQNMYELETQFRSASWDNLSNIYHAETETNGELRARQFASFMLAHAVNQALHDAEVIHYEFETSPWQQDVLDRYAGPYAELLAQAKKLTPIITNSRAFKKQKAA